MDGQMDGRTDENNLVISGFSPLISLSLLEAEAGKVKEIETVLALLT